MQRYAEICTLGERGTENLGMLQSRTGQNSPWILHQVFILLVTRGLLPLPLLLL